LNARALLQLDHDAGGIGSDVPESFLSSESHEPFESESSEILSSQSRVMTWWVRVESMSSHTNFKLLLYISWLRSTSGSSVAIGLPVDLQWL